MRREAIAWIAMMLSMGGVIAGFKGGMSVAAANAQFHAGEPNHLWGGLVGMALVMLGVLTSMTIGLIVIEVSSREGETK